jgi:hypothetical protein
MQMQLGREAVARFVSALRCGDLEAVLIEFDTMQRLGFLRAGFKKIAALSYDDIPEEVRRGFARLWQAYGDILRSEIADDFVLIDGLKKLLPKYDGGSVKLFRGERAYNRKVRTYGLSWTSEIDVARNHAKGMKRAAVGGTVLLVTIAPAHAIIADENALYGVHDESEFVVDRRLLRAVEVIERFSQAE